MFGVSRCGRGLGKGPVDPFEPQAFWALHMCVHCTPYVLYMPTSYVIITLRQHRHLRCHGHYCRQTLLLVFQ